MTDGEAPLVIESPRVLSNKGVMVNVITVIATEDDYEATDPAEYEKRLVRISNRVMADIEETWGTYEAWNTALQVQTFKTVIRSLAIVWNEEGTAVAEMLIDGQMEIYQLALMVAAFRANGVPVDDLGKLLERGLEEAAKGREQIREAMLTAFDQPKATTTRRTARRSSGSNPGLEAVKDSLQSGSSRKRATSSRQADTPGQAG